MGSHRDNGQHFGLPSAASGVVWSEFAFILHTISEADAAVWERSMERSPVYAVFRLVAPMLAAAAVFLVLAGVAPTSYVGEFFLNGWYVQAASTWLFFVGLWLWAEKALPMVQSRELAKHVRIRTQHSEADVHRLLQTVPAGWPKLLTIRRILRLLEEVKAGQDPRALNELLSRQDARHVERGHLVVDSLKGIIPVIGFIGTVLGLSMGMLAFPDVADPTKLRTALLDFSRSLSLAFNTTLLALIYTIILMLLTLVSRESERNLLERLDTVAEDLVRMTR